MFRIMNDGGRVVTWGGGGGIKGVDGEGRHVGDQDIGRELEADR